MDIFDVIESADPVDTPKSRVDRLSALRDLDTRLDGFLRLAETSEECAARCRVASGELLEVSKQHGMSPEDLVKFAVRSWEQDHGQTDSRPHRYEPIRPREPESVTASRVESPSEEPANLNLSKSDRRGSGPMEIPSSACPGCGQPVDVEYFDDKFAACPACGQGLEELRDVPGTLDMDVPFERDTDIPDSADRPMREANLAPGRVAVQSDPQKAQVKAQIAELQTQVDLTQDQRQQHQLKSQIESLKAQIAVASRSSRLASQHEQAEAATLLVPDSIPERDDWGDLGPGDYVAFRDLEGVTRLGKVSNVHQDFGATSYEIAGFSGDRIDIEGTIGYTLLGRFDGQDWESQIGNDHSEKGQR